MLPVVEGVNRASHYTALSNLLLFPFTTMLYLTTVNWKSMLVAILTGGLLIMINARFLISNIALFREPKPMAAWKVFKLSAQYLFLVLLLLTVGHIF